METPRMYYGENLDNNKPVVTIHPIESQDGILVKVQPPLRPLGSTVGHVPCDIVIVIDVSEDMGRDAPEPPPADGVEENLPLAVNTFLDLAKHAARTILSTLNEDDRLGIVAFRSNVCGHEEMIMQELVSMTEAHKKEVDTKIGQVKIQQGAYLWPAIDVGLKMLQPGDAGGRVPALMLLTARRFTSWCERLFMQSDFDANLADTVQRGDGSNFATRLQSLSPLPAIINTFGFGEEVEANLLKSIAEVSSGNYSFVADIEMIKDVFIPAVAHLQSTYATQCTLVLSAPEGVLLKPTTGKSIARPWDEADGEREVTVRLGNLQYGQSRDIYLENVNESRQQTTFSLQETNKTMVAKLTYSRMQFPQDHVFAEQDMLVTSPLTGSVIAYHQSRSMLCKLLSTFFQLTEDLEYKTPSFRSMEYYREELQRACSTIPARNYEDEDNVSLMEDLNGQITAALSGKDIFEDWGSHYLLSLWDAHAKQLRNTFDDPGPLRYNNNPFFIECCDALLIAYDRIPLPERSKWNDRVCFAASSPVLLVSGLEVPICTLQQGMMVKTPVGPRCVQAILKTPVHESLMCRVGNLVVTPWHPINIGQSEGNVCSESGWAFPTDITKQTTTYSGVIYSVLLESDRDVDAHAIRVGGVWGVTLGHGILSGSDVRAHSFFGDYSAVSKGLSGLGPGENGVYIGAGVRRDAGTGLVCGFKNLPFPDMSDKRSTDHVRQQSALPTVCA
ncbi:U-box domain-containing protein [Xylaria telfairii]|nr:U-box domain-containing protein [Xylaria telfairii]